LATANVLGSSITLGMRVFSRPSVDMLNELSEFQVERIRTTKSPKRLIATYDPEN